MREKKALVIGAGFAGLSAATSLAHAGWEVAILEKNESSGGRARQFTASGFTFDMGPSWYWMPDVFDRYFERFGKKTSDYYDLIRLDPSYRVVFGTDDYIDLPANLEELKQLFDDLEPGAGNNLTEFLKQAAYKYEVGINKLVYKPGRSLTEFMSPRLLLDMIRMDIFQSMHKHVRKYFKNERILQLIEFPILFLGATPQNTPALYSLMNYADISLGTWYPRGGMHEIVKGMVSLAEEMGVTFRYNCPVDKIHTVGGVATKVSTPQGEMEADAIIAACDYHHVEDMLLGPAERNYSEKYWDKRVMAPSSLLFYLGVDKKLDKLQHHNLFFDADFGKHAIEIYEDPAWPSDPLFYVSVTSKTDDTAAPEGCENVFLLMPIAPGIKDDDALREQYFDLMIDRLEERTGQEIRKHIIYKRSYALKDFEQDYHAYKGNAYGLANTLRQTAILKPSLKNRNIQNLYYTGQLTVPGPGVPPSLISGQVIAGEILKDFNYQPHERAI